MAFDYGSNAGKLRIPNPFRVENQFLIASSLPFLLGGLWLLLQANAQAGNGTSGPVLPVIGLAVIFLAAGLSLAGAAFAQLRFFFGLGRPQGLASELGQKKTGDSAEAGKLRELLESQTLRYPEPTGALNGLLYSIFPNLVFAPPVLQHLAQQRFRNFLYLALLLISFPITLISARAAAPGMQDAQAWIGILYLALAAWLILRSQQPTTVAPDISIAGLATFLAMVVAGPTIALSLYSNLPTPWLDPFPQVWILLLSPLPLYFLSYRALAGQLQQTPDTVVSQVLDRWNLTSHPGQILNEFDRAMQEAWQSGIPNRRYARQEAEVDTQQQSGSFHGLALEETQPQPVQQSEINLSSALASPRLRPILFLEISAWIFLTLSALFGAVAGLKWLHADPAGLWNVGLYAFCFGLLGLFAKRMAHALWNRFDYQSLVMWLELDGRYTTGQLESGNNLRDSIKTRSSVIQAEAMSFRLRVAWVHSVAFGKDAPRFVLSLSGEAQYCQSLAAHLKQFIEQQAVIFAPTSSADLERQNHLNRLNHASSHPQLQHSEVEALALLGTAENANV